MGWLIHTVEPYTTVFSLFWVTCSVLVRFSQRISLLSNWCSLPQNLTCQHKFRLWILFYSEHSKVCIHHMMSLCCRIRCLTLRHLAMKSCTRVAEGHNTALLFRCYCFDLYTGEEGSQLLRYMYCIHNGRACMIKHAEIISAWNHWLHTYIID